MTVVMSNNGNSNNYNNNHHYHLLPPQQESRLKLASALSVLSFCQQRLLKVARHECPKACKLEILRRNAFVLCT